MAVSAIYFEYLDDISLEYEDKGGEEMNTAVKKLGFTGHLEAKADSERLAIVETRSPVIKTIILSPVEAWQLAEFIRAVYGGSSFRERRLG